MLLADYRSYVTALEEVSRAFEDQDEWARKSILNTVQMGNFSMKSALCREPNNEYLPLLHLAQCFEEARWDEGGRLVQELNLDGKKVKLAFQASVNWASELDYLHSGKPANE